MFTPDRIENMRGSHQPQDGPKPDRCYVFLIDIAGSDELTAQSRRENGFSDRRDATVLTICEVSMPKEDLLPIPHRRRELTYSIATNAAIIGWERTADCSNITLQLVLPSKK
jgi:hypothetical protein